MRIGITIYDENNLQEIPLRLIAIGKLENGIVTSLDIIKHSKVFELPANTTLCLNDIPNPMHPDNIKAKELEERQAERIAYYVQEEGYQFIVFPNWETAEVPYDAELEKLRLAIGNIFTSKSTIKVYNVDLQAFQTTKGRIWTIRNGWVPQ